MPEDDELLAWAATPFKPLAGEVVFYSPTQLVALETIAFTEGQCVGYHETFASGATGDGSYVCQLTITAPAFELRAGGAPAVAGETEETDRKAPSTPMVTPMRLKLPELQPLWRCHFAVVYPPQIGRQQGSRWQLPERLSSGAAGQTAGPELFDAESNPADQQQRSPAVYGRGGGGDRCGAAVGWGLGERQASRQQQQRQG